MRGISTGFIVAAFQIALVGQVQPSFPEWRGGNLLLSGEWFAAPIVAVGEVTNVREYGKEAVRNLPWPMPPDVDTLYWCLGDFNTTTTVKGQLSTRSRKYLWASAQPGCNLFSEVSVLTRAKTRVWFLREEGAFLRPLFDGGAAKSFGLLPDWNQGPPLPATQRLGTLLLTPGANGDNLADYASYLWDIGDIACDLLGREECARQLLILGESRDTLLRENVCNFLKGQLATPCLSN
jgi:hypothetical protein